MDPQRQRNGSVRTATAERRSSPGSPTPLSASRFEPPPLEAPLTDIVRARVAREARSELEQVMAEAAHEGRAAGFEAGFLSGKAQVSAAVAEHEQATAQLRQATAALASASAALAGHDAATLTDLESVALEMAVGIAEALVERELAAVDDPVLEACRRAAHFVPSRGDVVVRVHPQTAARVNDDASEPDYAQQLAETLGAHHRITFVADASIEPGGCIVHVGSLRIDPQIGPALARIRSELGLDSAHDQCRAAGGAPAHPPDHPTAHPPAHPTAHPPAHTTAHTTAHPPAHPPAHTTNPPSTNRDLLAPLGEPGPLQG